MCELQGQSRTCVDEGDVLQDAVIVAFLAETGAVGEVETDQGCDQRAAARCS
jgi:hypothetical protein